MKLIYVTLNSSEEARNIGNELLVNNLANCVNFFPITTIYKYKGKVEEEPEVVLLIKTKDGYYKKVEEVVKKHISFENFIGQITVDKINDEFTKWLDNIVK